MKFRACHLPKGLKLNRGSGVVSGCIDKPGEYTITWKARNSSGCGKGKMVLRIGDTIALTPPMGWNSWNCWGLDISEDGCYLFSTSQARDSKGGNCVDIFKVTYK